jgi:hypothetical protein
MTGVVRPIKTQIEIKVLPMIMKKKVSWALLSNRFQRISIINHSPLRKVMPSLNRLDDHRSVKSLIRLLALFLALAVAAPVLLAQENGDRDADHGRFGDPVIGSWIAHVHLTDFTPAPQPPQPPLPYDFDNVGALLEGGINLNFDPQQGTGSGVWKEVGPRIYDTKFVQLNPNSGTISTVLGDNLILNPQGDELRGSFHGFDTDASKKVIGQYSGTVTLDRITLHSTP